PPARNEQRPEPTAAEASKRGHPVIACVVLSERAVIQDEPGNGHKKHHAPREVNNKYDRAHCRSLLGHCEVTRASDRTELTRLDARFRIKVLRFDLLVCFTVHIGKPLDRPTTQVVVSCGLA